ncbi:sulfatase family protein [Larkinella soli]|uniref:sulfatase family protein n=1 Tax=Larkinella soli TaxID=1770527 RepID=UPI0013E2BBD0|nr:sulfatase [Larkinella soli]
MTRILPILWGLLAVLHQVPAQTRPNVLWITCEDMSAHLPAYGDSTIRTPNIDRLAREGVRYRRMFSTNGVCAPSRSAIITGMYPNGIGSNHMRTVQGSRVGNGLIDYETVPPADVKCFPEYLRAAGYFCTNNSKTDYQFAAPFSAWDENGKAAHWRNRAAGQPFFSVFNLEVTHESQIWMRAARPLRVDPARVRLPPYYPENTVIRKDLARNYDNIMVMDSLVGVILKQLEADGLLDKTIIFFFSDHGSGQAWYKRELYDRGLHVPFIVRYPDRKGAGTWEDDLHSFVDLGPTVLSLAGVPVPKHMQGQAFLGNQRARTPRTHIFAARDRMDEQYDCVRAVRDKRFKYIRNYQPDRPYYQDLAYRKQMPMMLEILRLQEKGQLPEITGRWFGPKPAEELYDTEKDPFELTNLAGNSAYRPQMEQLRRLEQQWVRQVQDKGFMQERDLIRLFWPNNRQPETALPDVQTKAVSDTEYLITLTCNTPGASIGYRIDEGPWRLYTQPFRLPKTSHLTTKAARIGFKPSEESTMIATNK